MLLRSSPAHVANYETSYSGHSRVHRPMTPRSPPASCRYARLLKRQPQAAGMRAGAVAGLAHPRPGPMWVCCASGDAVFAAKTAAARWGPPVTRCVLVRETRQWRRAS